MRQRSFVILVATVAFLLVGAVAVYAYDAAHEHQIADGVKAGGVSIGGLRTSAARAKLRRVLAVRLNQPVYATYKGARFRLDPAAARLRVDIDGMVSEALQKSRGGNVLSRTVRGVFGGSVHADVPVRATYDHRVVSRLVKGATLRRGIESALAVPGGDRTVPIRAVPIQPKVTTSQLAANYATIIAIDRPSFVLALYKHLKRVKTYTIAVGRQGLETPAGEYTVTDKQIDPSWHVPNSSWAGSLAGQVIPPGPQDPLKARWIGITDGAGIHGTEELGSLGTAASHGCIRMLVPDVIQLYSLTPLSSPVYVR